MQSHEIHTNGSVGTTGITIRRLDAADAVALQRLADVDSAPVPEGDWLGLEIEGRLLAAVSLDGRGTIADPFSRTEELRALLELRADQLRHRKRRFRARGHARTDTPLAGHGRLLSLPARPF